MSERAAVTRAKAQAYARGNRAKKSAILDELVELTGWHREYARAAVRDGLKLKVVRLGPLWTDAWAEDHRRVDHVLGGLAGSGG